MPRILRTWSILAAGNEDAEKATIRKDAEVIDISSDSESDKETKSVSSEHEPSKGSLSSVVTNVAKTADISGLVPETQSDQLKVTISLPLAEKQQPEIKVSAFSPVLNDEESENKGSKNSQSVDKYYHIRSFISGPVTSESSVNESVIGSFCGQSDVPAPSQQGETKVNVNWFGVKGESECKTPGDSGSCIDHDQKSTDCWMDPIDPRTVHWKNTADPLDAGDVEHLGSSTAHEHKPLLSPCKTPDDSGSGIDQNQKRTVHWIDPADPWTIHWRSVADPLDVGDAKHPGSLAVHESKPLLSSACSQTEPKKSWAVETKPVVSWAAIEIEPVVSWACSKTEPLESWSVETKPTVSWAASETEPMESWGVEMKPVVSWAHNETKPAVLCFDSETISSGQLDVTNSKLTGLRNIHETHSADPRYSESLKIKPKAEAESCEYNSDELEILSFDEDVDIEALPLSQSPVLPASQGADPLLSTGTGNCQIGRATKDGISTGPYATIKKVLDEALRVFKSSSRFNHLKLPQDSNTGKMDNCDISAEILFKKALRFQPVVLLERLKNTGLSPPQAPVFSDNRGLWKRRSLDQTIASSAQKAATNSHQASEAGRQNICDTGGNQNMQQISLGSLNELAAHSVGNTISEVGSSGPPEISASGGKTSTAVKGQGKGLRERKITHLLPVTARGSADCRFCLHQTNHNPHHHNTHHEGGADLLHNSHEVPAKSCQFTNSPHKQKSPVRKKPLVKKKSKIKKSSRPQRTLLNTKFNCEIPKKLKVADTVELGILSCGHTCTKCTSAETYKWLEDHGYYMRNTFTKRRMDLLNTKLATSSVNDIILWNLWEINQLVQHKSRFYYDPEKGSIILRSLAQMPGESPAPQKAVFSINSRQSIPQSSPPPGSASQPNVIGFPMVDRAAAQPRKRKAAVGHLKRPTQRKLMAKIIGQRIDPQTTYSNAEQSVQHPTLNTIETPDQWQSTNSNVEQSVQHSTLNTIEVPDQWQGTYSNLEQLLQHSTLKIIAAPDQWQNTYSNVEQLLQHSTLKIIAAPDQCQSTYSNLEQLLKHSTLKIIEMPEQWQSTYSNVEQLVQQQTSLSTTEEPDQWQNTYSNVEQSVQHPTLNITEVPDQWQSTYSNVEQSIQHPKLNAIEEPDQWQSTDNNVEQSVQQQTSLSPTEEPVKEQSTLSTIDHTAKLKTLLNNIEQSIQRQITLSKLERSVQQEITLNDTDTTPEQQQQSTRRNIEELVQTQASTGNFEENNDKDSAALELISERLEESPIHTEDSSSAELPHLWPELVDVPQAPREAT